MASPNANPKATPLDALPSAQSAHDNIPPEMEGLSKVIEELSTNEHTVPPINMNDPNMRIQLQPSQPMEAPMNAAGFLGAQKPMLDRILLDLKDSIVVFITFILLGFEPVHKVLAGAVGRVSENPYVLLALKGVLAGVAFYAIKKLI